MQSKKGGKKERTHGHGQQCGHCGAGWMWVDMEEGIERKMVIKK